jgi:hypothetical protein
MHSSIVKRIIEIYYSNKNCSDLYHYVSIESQILHRCLQECFLYNGNKYYLWYREGISIEELKL